MILRLISWRMGALIVVLVWLSSGALAAQAQQPARLWTDLVRDATVAIGVPRNAKITTGGKVAEKKVFAPIGTGAIFGLPEDQSGTPWLVTAKHVFFEPDSKWDPDVVRLRFAWSDKQSVEDYLGVEIPLKTKGRRLWTPHPDPSVDLAAIPLNLPVESVGRQSAQVIPLGNFAAPDDVFEGAAVLVFGYPGAVGPSFWTRALVRSGTIAWVDPKSPTESPLLIDAMVFPGNSGGPVFRVPTGSDRHGNFAVGGRPAFLGIVSQGRREPTPVSAAGKHVEMQGPQGPVKLVSEGWIGVGVIEPAARVLRLLTAAKAAGRVK